MFQVRKTVKNPLAGPKSYEEYQAIIDQGIVDLDSKKRLDFGARELLKNRASGVQFGICWDGNPELELVLVTPRELGFASQSDIPVAWVSTEARQHGLKRCEPAVAILLSLQGGTGLEGA